MSKSQLTESDLAVLLGQLPQIFLEQNAKLYRVHRMLNDPAEFTPLRSPAEIRRGHAVGVCELAFSPLEAFADVFGGLRVVRQENVDARLVSVLNPGRRLRLADLRLSRSRLRSLLLASGPGLQADTYEMAEAVSERITRSEFLDEIRAALLRLNYDGAITRGLADEREQRLRERRGSPPESEDELARGIVEVFGRLDGDGKELLPVESNVIDDELLEDASEVLDIEVAPATTLRGNEDADVDWEFYE
jgi:hypothetical protein